MDLKNIYNKEGELVIDNVKWYIYHKLLKDSHITNKRAIELAKDIANDSYLDGVLSYEDAMELLNKENCPFGDLVRVLLVSGRYDDETKRNMLEV